MNLSKQSAIPIFADILRYLLRTSAFLIIMIISVILNSPSETVAAEPCPDGKPLAFNGAEGFGRCAQGGKGGVVVPVTNLNNTGPGSLRECAEVMSGPRICEIRITGTIALSPVTGNSSNIDIVNDYLTLDGSTAPSGGIALKGGGLTIKANHIIVRYLRIRPGLDDWTQRGVNTNAVAIQSNEGVSKHDIIVDHVSASWTSDDLVYVIYGSDNVTIQWSIFSEGLVNCGSGCTGKGFLMGYGAKSVSFHHNLSAHNWIRWPEYTGGGDYVGGTGQLDFVNNVHYNGNGTDTIMWGYHGPQYANFVGNYYKQGLDGPATVPLNQTYASIRTKGQNTYTTQSGLFVQGNYGRYWPTSCNGCNAVIGLAVPDKNIIWGDDGGIPISTTRYPYPLVTTTSAVQAYEDVLNGAGAFPRDVADARIVADVRNGTGHWINDPAAVGGWPVLTGTSDTIAPASPQNLRIQ